MYNDHRIGITAPVMPLLSRKSLLAIAAVTDVALNARIGALSSKALAKSLHLPPRHLEPVLQALVREGILKAVRGPHGGSFRRGGLDLGNGGERILGLALAHQRRGPGAVGRSKIAASRSRVLGSLRLCRLLWLQPSLVLPT